MGNLFMDIISDKVLDEIMNAIIGKSKEEIQALLDNNKKQKLLLRAIEKIVRSDFFKIEFKNVNYVADANLIMSIPDEKISLAIKKEDIVQNIFPILSRCLITAEHDVDLSTLFVCIVEQYILLAATTTTTFDIITHQQNNFAQMGMNLDSLKNIFNNNREREISIKIKNQEVIRDKMKNISAKSIKILFVSYNTLISKKNILSKWPGGNPTGSKLISAMKLQTEEIVTNIGAYINEDFFINPIVVDEENPFTNGGIREIDYFTFSELVLKTRGVKAIDELLKYKEILDSETYYLLLELQNELNSNYIPSLYELDIQDLIKKYNVQKVDDLDGLRGFYLNIGNILIKLSKCLYLYE